MPIVIPLQYASPSMWKFPSYSHLKKLPNSQVMIIFAGSASNYNKISVFLAMIAIFLPYLYTSLSHYLRYFPNISAALSLIICDVSQIFPQLFISLFARSKQLLIGGSRFARKEVSVERNIGKNRWKKVYRRKISPLPIFSHGALSSSPQLLLSTSFFDQGPCLSFFWGEYRELWRC